MSGYFKLIYRMFWKRDEECYAQYFFQEKVLVSKEKACKMSAHQKRPHGKLERFRTLALHQILKSFKKNLL